MKIRLLLKSGHLFYYNFINLVKTASRLHPGWILRIYYDKSIDLSIKCKIECLKDDTDNLIDNVDFCSTKIIPVKNSFTETWDASFMHAMMWRWLPIVSYLCLFIFPLNFEIYLTCFFLTRATVLLMFFLVEI